jgi:hypothetical protein
MRRSYLVLPIALALASGVATAPLMQHAWAAVEISISIAPPPLVVYEQPPLPGPGYMWSPGYWAYADDDYYWVPGTWVEPPQVGLLWTPGYWGFNDGNYVFNAGYWGPTVGFYGGVDYGFGYSGDGFHGGRWENGAFFYNTAAWNVGGVHVAHSYREALAHRETSNRVSFNGGNGGINVRATAAQERSAHERHVQATAMQTQQRDEARKDPRLHASQNHGAPPVAATGKAGDFKSHPVAATNKPEPNVGRAAETKPGTEPAERKAATPNASQPEERNAARPEAKPAEHEAAHPNAAQPEERKAATPDTAHPAERNAARPVEGRPETESRHVNPATEQHPEALRKEEKPAPRTETEHATTPSARAMHPEPRPAEQPAVAHPTARPPVHPAEAPHPATAPRPMAEPHAAAPQGEAHPAPRQEEKKP